LSLQCGDIGPLMIAAMRLIQAALVLARKPAGVL
jgi:hypothetical protein